MPPHASPVDLSLTPAASAPPGHVSNLEHPVTKDVTGSIIITAVLMLLSTTFLVIRVYTKAFLARMFGIDDVMLILAWCMSMMVQIVIVYYMANDIIGTHIWDLALGDFKMLARLTTTVSVVYLALMALCKVSVLLFYLKLSREKWFTRAIYTTMALVSGYSLALIFALVFACTPLKRVWDVTITEGHCINQGEIYLATAGFNAATDIILLALPMPMISKLQIPSRQKIGLVAIFGVASFTMVTSIVRLSLMPPLVRSPDMPWNLKEPATWVNIEGNLVVICGCLPILRLFLKHTFPRLIGETTYGEASRKTPQKQSNTPMDSSELSTLSKPNRRRSYLRMNGSDGMATEAGCEDSSEKGIIKTTAVTVDTIEVDRLERHDSSTEYTISASPTPYSQLSPGSNGSRFDRPHMPPRHN